MWSARTGRVIGCVCGPRGSIKHQLPLCCWMGNAQRNELCVCSQLGRLQDPLFVLIYPHSVSVEQGIHSLGCPRRSRSRVLKSVVPLVR